MGLLQITALGTLGYLGYRYWNKHSAGTHAAFATGDADDGNFAKVRDAGPEAMRDPVKREWTATDQASDESFPASDPPGNY